MKKWLSLLLSFLLTLSIASCGASQGGEIISTTVIQNSPDVSAPVESQVPEEPELLDPDGTYDSKEEVALYLLQYGCLPSNYMTKNEARSLGWEGGSLEKYAPGMCIGGDRFGNREGLLPKAEGRTYTECDIDTLGEKERGAKRIVFSSDGLIYYTSNHYASFELIYGEEDQR